MNIVWNLYLGNDYHIYIYISTIDPNDFHINPVNIFSSNAIYYIGFISPAILYALRIESYKIKSVKVKRMNVDSKFNL